MGRLLGLEVGKKMARRVRCVNRGGDEGQTKEGKNRARYFAVRWQGLEMSLSLNRVCRWGLVGVVMGLVPWFAAAEESEKPKLPIGMNLAGIADYEPGFPFKNLMWGARPWLTRNLTEGGPFNTELASKFEYDENGYPLEVPFQPEGADQPQLVFTIIPNVTEPGEYVVLYEGDGEIVAAMGTRVVSSEPGRVVLNLANRGAGEGYEGITIRRSTRGDHIRNIRIVRVEDEKADLEANPFREDFLEYVRLWPVVRFMDWAVTNNSLEKEWAGRKKRSFYTMVGQGGDAIGRWGPKPTEFTLMFSGGVAIEVMIQLVNMVKVDPWFCVPHRATPEYMTEFARLVKETLDPSLTAYVEYSNEVWNWQFQQAGWMLQSKIAGDLLAGQDPNGWQGGVAPEEFPFDDGTVAKEGGSDHPERMGALMRRCFEHWEKVFEGDSRKRMVTVIGVQHSWTDTAKRTVRWVMNHGGADAVASGGYFGPNEEIYSRWAKAGADLTVDQVLADMAEALEKDTAVWTREIGELAREHGIRFLVYEGGQHIQPKGQEELPYMPALRDTQFSRGLYDLYMKNFAIHVEAGCDLFMAFASISRQGTRWGSWGHQEYYGQSRDEIPKFGALLDAQAGRR
ncbi:MAG: hypothetical protein SNJ84_01715 [Verrucomicrobiia bacterium]